ncbi:MAG: hypothetical protein E7168_01180 [Firmicutes bacterium]|nr:hypothetical protein [Bacillota bacterium]
MINLKEKYKATDFIGNKIGKITIIDYLGTIKKEKGNNHKFWLGKCECGQEVHLKANEIVKKKRKCCRYCSSPGKTHGMTNTRIFNIWQSMIGRCTNPNNQDYYNYGARNIKVCEEWKNSFEKFYDWAIKNGYSSNLTLDRIDNNNNYCPNNCRWATTLEQANNKRNNIIIEYNGTKDTLSNWARKTGINSRCLQYRYYHNWDIEKMLTFKPKVGKNQYIPKKVLCIETGIVYDSVGDAFKCTGINKTVIWNVCNNRRKTAGGYHWRYLQK